LVHGGVAWFGVLHRDGRRTDLSVIGLDKQDMLAEAKKAALDEAAVRIQEVRAQIARVRRE
jgi:hypothetical protein